MAADLYAEPISVTSASECRFYHSMDLPRSGFREGDWDLRGKFDAYTGNVPLKGKTVLDVGTASGFITFEAEKRGATVVSVDASSPAVWDRLPLRQSLYSTNRALWETEQQTYLESLKKSYWLAHHEFNSHAKAYYGNVYALPPELGEFDVVIVGQILVHLSDAIRALTSIANRCRDTLVIVEGMISLNLRIARFLGKPNRPEMDFAFWHYSVGFYRTLMAGMGFKLQSRNVERYRCNSWNRSMRITTLVFRRE